MHALLLDKKELNDIVIQAAEQASLPKVSQHTLVFIT